MRLRTAIIALLMCIGLQAQPLQFSQLTIKDGLSNNSIIGLGEDAQGLLWIAMPGSLCTFDGETFTPLSTDNLPNNRVDRLCLDASGTMWVQCFEQHDMVSRYDTLTHRFVTYHKTEISDSLWQEAVKPLNRTFADPRSNRIWAVEKRMLWQKDASGKQQPFSYTGQTAIDAKLGDEVIFCLLLDSRGMLWVGSANTGLFFADTRETSYQRITFTTPVLVRSTCRDHHAALWFATPNSLNTVAEGHKTYRPVSYPLNDSIEGRRIRPILEDSQQRLWLGTFDGLYLKAGDSETFSRIDFADKNNHAVYALCEDEEKRLWIGTDNALYRTQLNSDNMQPQLVDSTLQHIIDIYVGADYCWVATNEGLYRLTDSGKQQWHDEETHCVLTDSQGQTWAGTDDGLYRVTADGLKPFASPADGHVVKDLLCWRDFLWCCYDQGICCVNIYTGKVTRLHTLYNEYFEGAASLDKRTATLFFGGTKGIDCFNADSLDEQLRSASRQLWLEEERLELAQEVKQPVATASSKWPFFIIIIVLAGALVVVAIYLRRRKRQEPVQQQEESGEPSPFVVKATEIVTAHMGDAGFTAEQLAQEMAMSRTKLFTLMKQETGKAAMEFVRDIRLDYAARQLEAGTPVAEIATACGFSDASSFRRSFVKKFGVTPSQYRQQQNT